MAKLIAHTEVFVTKESAQFDAYGQPIPGERFSARVAVVFVHSSNKRESVRRDASASQRNAGEVTADARLLFKPDADIAKGDKIEVAGMTVQALSVLPRIDLDGHVNHLQVDCSAWA